jgi:rhamnulokinase
MTTMVAVDLGAQSGRVAVGRFDGDRLEVEVTRRFANVPVKTRDRLHWDSPQLCRDVLEGLGAAGEGAEAVDSIAVDSWGVDFGLLDRAGQLLGNPVHYRDVRRARAFDRALERVPARELYERTGIQLLAINSLFELAAMADEGDPALDAAETLLMIPDLLHHWLAGSRVTERTNASTTQCLDADHGGWATDLLERLDVPTGFLPVIVAPGTDLGRLTSDVATRTGLGAARVIAVATHDTASAVVAVPFRAVGSAYISVGTWSLVGVEVGQPVIDDVTFAANLTNEVGVAGTYRLLRNVTGLWLINECRNAWARAGRDYTFEELDALAAEAPPLRALIEPNDPRFDEPGDMPQRVREFCLATGQSEPGDAGAVVRCILESLALKHAQTIRLLAGATGAAPAEVHIVGGGARNELLCRWTADAMQLPVLCGPEEATVVGNLLLQAIALGELSSVAEAREVVRRSFPPTIYEPRDSPAWQEARERFARLRPARSPESVGA